MDEGREPKDRIEHIVREAEEGAAFDFNPAAWSAMEQKLDELEPMPFSVWKIIFPLVGVAVILMLLLWPISAQDRLNVSERTVSEKVSESEPEPAATDDQGKENTGEVIETEEADNTANNQETVSTDQPKNSPDNNIAQDVQDEKKSAESNPVLTPDTSNKTQTTSPAVSIRSVLLLERASKEEEQSPVGGNDLLDKNQQVDMLSVYWNPTPIIFPEPNLIFEVDSSNFKDGEPEEYFERSKWALSAMVSLDMSATGLDGFTDPGTMFGLNVEYYFTKSWSIQTGAAISVKKYRALGSEYETPGWIAARPDDFLEALANCLVIDLPLNFRKYFTTKKGRTFFVSTGVSSYLMLRESYEYEYTQERPNWLNEWTIRNRNQHYFGILNLSFGFEKPIGKNLALGIEPFMKLPLTGIGAGRVRFLSFGTNIAIKLRK